MLHWGMLGPCWHPYPVLLVHPTQAEPCCFQGRLGVCFETLWRSMGRGGGLHHMHYVFFQKKNFLSAHSRGSPKSGGQNQNTWGPQVGGNGTSPLHSWGSPKRGGKNQNRWGLQVGGNATSPLHSQGSPKRGGQNQNRWGPQVGGNATSPRGTKSELAA